jgi:hypothetical protein
MSLTSFSVKRPRSFPSSTTGTRHTRTGENSYSRPHQLS